MKRNLLLVITLISIMLLVALPANAAESFELIPSGANWTKADHGGASVMIEEQDGVFVFSGSFSGTWPAATTMYTSEPVTAPIDSYSLVYDFTVEGGATNINFFFDDGNGGNVSYSICNSMFADRDYDSGSGDLKTGEYAGAIKLSDLVETTMLYGSEPFPVNAILDGSLRFIGVQVYSVNGSVITVRAMDLAHNDDVPEAPPTEESTSQEESAPVSAAESSVENTSMEVSDETGSVAESLPAESESEAIASQDAEGSAPEEDRNDGKAATSIYVTIIVSVAVLTCVVIAIILVKKKFSQK